MNKFDENLKKKIREEKVKVPEDITKNIDNILSNLPEKKIKKPNFARKIIATVAGFAVMFLVVIPNLSPSYANAAEDIPIIGDFIKVVTVRNYFYNDNSHEMDIKVPEIEGKNKATDYINKDVDELTKILVNQFYNDLEISGNNGHGSINVNYETVSDSKKWFTLKLSVTEISASSNSYYRYYHIDKVKGKIIKLEDLFNSDDFINIISDEIRKQMDESMKKDDSLIYWQADDVGSEAFTKIEKDHNFYFDKEGNIVIPFDKYEIAPGYMGTPEFTVKKAILKDVLKSEYR